MAPDPANQFHSPYLGMGNNPIIAVDPDGGHVYGWQQYIQMLQMNSEWVGDYHAAWNDQLDWIYGRGIDYGISGGFAGTVLGVWNWGPSGE